VPDQESTPWRRAAARRKQIDGLGRSIAADALDFVRQAYARTTRRKRKLSSGNLRLVVSIAKRVPADNRGPVVPV